MSAIPSHRTCPWMPAMNRAEPLHFYSKAEHVSWLTASLGAKRLVEDADFRDLMCKTRERWLKLSSIREAGYARAWGPILAAEGDDAARLLMAIDADGAIAREGMPDGFAHLDQAMRVKLRITAEEQHEDGLVTYQRA